MTKNTLRTVEGKVYVYDLVIDKLILNNTGEYNCSIKIGDKHYETPMMKLKVYNFNITAGKDTYQLAGNANTIICRADQPGAGK